MTGHESDEAFALSLVARGNGTFPLAEHRRYDEAIVAFHLENPDYVTVYLRREDLTRGIFEYRLVPCDIPEQPDAPEPAPREVANALAERFLCDTLVVLKEMPRAIRRGAMERALKRLEAGGSLEPGDAELLRGFVGAWDRAASP